MQLGGVGAATELHRGDRGRVRRTTNDRNVVKEFDEAVRGRIAETANSALRDLKRSIRDQFGEPPVTTYTAEQAGAAQRAVTALAEVDRAFAPYRLRKTIAYCECCTDPKLIERLMSVSRDDLSEDDVAAVAGSLLYTIGDANDLKYFVPRFCRDTLVIPLYDIDAAFDQCARAGFNEWPADEQRAVRTFLGAAWRSALLAASRRNLSELTDPWLVILDSMGSLGFLGDALIVWDTEHGDAADSRLLDLLDMLHVGSGPLSVSGAGGYSDNSAAYDVLEAWLRSDAVRRRIDAVLESSRTTDRELAGRIDVVLQALDTRPLK